MTQVAFDTDDYTLDDLLGLRDAFAECAGQGERQDGDAVDMIWQDIQTAFYERNAETASDVLVKMVTLNGDDMSSQGKWAESVHQGAMKHLPRFATAWLQECFERHQRVQLDQEASQ